ncbi:hypothetical protein R3P38DRAFT_1295004 [Favolaschia claudopus]|uniref:DUF6534 domain-containing protein n=1 Tax=Favolaschia claudopus TaxID=2862362 RepID=A0AAW0AYH8_9AGAR
MSASTALHLVPRHSLIPMDKLLGPWMLGMVISSIIFGITCLQVYLYYTKFASKDSTFLKAFVAFLFSVEILHLTMLTMSYYVASVTNFGDFVAIALGPWSLRAQIVIGVFLGTLVQLFYAFRIWTLSHKSPYLPVIIILCSFGALAFSIVYTIRASITQKFDNNSEVIPFSTSALALEVACDIFITLGMVFSLLNQRTDYQRTNRVLNILIAYTVNSGALTMIFAVCTLVLFLASKSTLLYSFFFFILVRLYGCSFMSILNSREYVRSQLKVPRAEMVTMPIHSSRTDTAVTESKAATNMSGIVFGPNPGHETQFSAV